MSAARTLAVLIALAIGTPACTRRPVYPIRTVRVLAQEELDCPDISYMYGSGSTYKAVGCGRRAVYVCQTPRLVSWWKSVRVIRSDAVRVDEEDLICALAWVERSD